MTPEHRTTPSPSTVGPILAAALAAIVMVAVGVVYLSSGLVVPWWALLLLIGVWATLAWYGVRLARARSYAVLAVPVSAAAVWVIVVSLGGQFLGWTA